MTAPNPEGDAVLVPREPTQAMLEAAYNAPHENYEAPDPRDVWSAMLSAAPAALQPSPDGVREKVALRNRLQEMMLGTPITEERNTYNDGLFNGLCRAIEAFDRAFPAVATTDVAALPPVSGVSIAHLNAEQQADIRAHVEGLTEQEADTYEAPAHGWTCFHCGQTFKTIRGAELHFGEDVKGRPVCQDVRRAIFEVIGDFRLSNMRDEDGGDYPLVDLMSNPAPDDISTGEEQIKALADEIAERVAALYARQQAAPDEA